MRVFITDTQEINDQITYYRSWRAFPEVGNLKVWRYRFITRSHRRKINFDYSMASWWAWWMINRVVGTLCASLSTSCAYSSSRRFSATSLYTNYLNCTEIKQFLYFLLIYMKLKEVQMSHRFLKFATEEFLCGRCSLPNNIVLVAKATHLSNVLFPLKRIWFHFINLSIFTNRRKQPFYSFAAFLNSRRRTGSSFYAKNWRKISLY